MQEAEESASKLDSAFANTGKTVGRTRAQLDDLASEIQRTTTLSDDLVKEAEAILLSFDKVRGQAFERTTKVAADLSARLGTDLKSSIKQVGLALQDPVAGLTLLRRSGVTFSDSQKNLIKSLHETGQSAAAQNVILTELERRYGGAAAAARNTLSGAITGLKNAFGDLFEGTRESTSGVVSAINSISKTLSDPAIKEGIDTLISGFTKLIDLLIKGVSLLGQFESGLLKLATKKGDRADAIRGFLAGALPAPLQPLALLAQAGSESPRTRGPTGAQRGRGRQPGAEDTGIVAVQTLEEINITVRKIVDENGDLMRQWNDQTKTAIQQQAAEYTKLKTTLQFLRDEGLISPEEFKKRLGGSLDELLPEIDLNEIRAKYISLKKETTELGEFMKGVWQGVGRSIQSTLSDALYEWRLSWRSLLDITRRALADITSAIITSGIKNALKSVSSSSSSSSGGFWAGVLKAFGLAGGGRFDGVRMVGEDGPELVAGTGRVINQRQMAFAGAGAKITFAPVNYFNIIEREDPEATKRELAQYVETRNAQQQAEFVRILRRSGVEVKG